MSLPFDPSAFSVKKATSKLEDLSAEELESLRDAELAGKNRITLITAIDDELSDDIEEAAEQAEEAAAEPVAPAAAAPASQPRRGRLSRSQMRDIRNQAKAAREDLPSTLHLAPAGPHAGVLISEERIVDTARREARESREEAHEESILLLE
jgi:hypothetical protein